MEYKYDDEVLLNLWFNGIEGLGNKGKTRLKEYYGDVSRIYNEPEERIRRVLGQRLSARLRWNERPEDKREYMKRLEEREIWVIFPKHELYPDKLRNIYDSPHILYGRGRHMKSADEYNSCIGIVGGRQPDTYGKEIARSMAKKLAEGGITIVSGLARGIDSMAHKGALEGNGYTIGVLGCGINVTYPNENIELFTRLLKNGTIISEYGLNVAPSAGMFPQRNRIISGLSDGVLVIEAKEKSGSLITADWALDQGKQVYAVPGRVLDSNCLGSNNLIKNGAMCVTAPEDILQDLGRESQTDKGATAYKIQTREEYAKENNLAPLEEMVYSCLSLEPKYIDDIIEELKIGVSSAISVLYSMEEKNIIKQPIRGYYITAI